MNVTVEFGAGQFWVCWEEPGFEASVAFDNVSDAQEFARGLS